MDHTSASINQPITTAEVERFLVDEAALLDEWKLTEWLELWTDDGQYLIPSLDSPSADPREALFLIADDMVTLRSRVRQLLGHAAWAENPRSRTRRLVTNFRILESNAGTSTPATATVTANFAAWRFQLGTTDTYVGKYVHQLVRGPAGGLLFRERRAVLDMETLRPHGRVSFIL